MKQSIWNKRIPTLLGIALIVIGTAFTTYLVRSGIIIVGRASPAYTPQNVRITNSTDNSFTVSYATKESTVGSLSFGTDEKATTTILDDRDQEAGNVTAYRVHYFTTHNLQPKTKYFFSITSNQTVFLNNNELFTVTTGETLHDTPPQQNPIAGKILFPQDAPSKEAIVYLTAKNAQTISVLVKSDGNYILPLNSIRDQTLQSYATFTPEDILTMLIVGSSQTSNVNVSLKQINPIPAVMLSNNYDFTLATTPIASSSGESVGFPSFLAIPSSKDPKIISPKEDDNFVDAQPLLRGTASPSAKVKIIIQSEEPLEADITADANGNWTYRPQTPLSAGEHTISIVTRDASGILKTISQSFTVYAAGTQIESATPSASPIPSITQTPTPTPSPATPTTVVLPTVSLSPTPSTPTVSPTNIPSPTLVPTMPSKGGVQLPPPGSSSGTIAVIAVFSTILVGILLFLLTRGGISSL